MYAKADNPRWVRAILSWPWLLPISRIALVSAFLIGGIQKLTDLNGAIAEQAHFGLELASPWAIAAVIVEIGGSALVILGRFVWLGAGGLGVLTAIAMLTANNFWTMEGHDRFTALNAFFEHLGLIAGLVLVSVLYLHAQGEKLHEAFHDLQPSP